MRRTSAVERDRGVRRNAGVRSGMRAAAVLIALSVLACGCRAAPSVRDKAVLDNVDLAAANNQLLLLNILRAKERVPMFFTSPGGPTDTMSAEASLESHVPIGPKAGNVYGVTAGVTGTAERVLGTGVVDSDEFWKGVTTPVAASTVEYYWSQGWQRELLMLLCVQKIVKSTKDACGKSAPPCTYYNYVGGPGQHGRFNDFRRAIGDLLEEKAEWKSEPENIWIGPAFERGQFSIEQIAAAKEQGLVLLPCGVGCPDAGPCPTGGLWRLAKKDVAYYFDFPSGSKPPAPIMTQSTRHSESPAAAGARSTKAEVSYELTMRSPEAILYYLGEIVRAQEEDGFVATIRLRAPDGVARGEEAAIFMLRCGVPGDDCPGLGVDYCGRHYGVPCDGSEGRTKQTLSLVAQFLALTKSAKDLPSTNVVQLIGR